MAKEIVYPWPHKNITFQVDSDTVNNYRKENANYVIEIDDNSPNKDLCVIYFSSHNIYYPNTPESFYKNIIRNDKYEWRNNTPISAYKQIFIRDLYKQWYIRGVNNIQITPPDLLNLLKHHTSGFRVITVGSSAGAYAAILYGIQLCAEKVFAFNPQFELNSQLETTSEEINPVLFRDRENKLMEYYDITSVIKQKPDNNIFYFFSEKSSWDKQQYEYLAASNADLHVNTIGFKNRLHGIPFPRVALTKVLNLSDKELKGLCGRNIDPIMFSIRQVGFIKTIIGVSKQLLKAVAKKF